LPDLSPKQKAFVREYLIDGNGTQAAIRAGYSKKTAQEQSSRLLSKVIVKEALEAGQERQQKRHDITIDSLTADYIMDRQQARALDMPSVAVTATSALAKLHGLDVTKVEHTGNIIIGDKDADCG